MNIMKYAEKKSSLILSLFFSAARKRTILTQNPSKANGTINEIVTLTNDHIPYRVVPSPLVKIGSRINPSKSRTILAITT